MNGDSLWSKGGDWDESGQRNLLQLPIASTTSCGSGTVANASSRTIFFVAESNESSFFTVDGARNFFSNEGLKRAWKSVLLSSPFGKEFFCKTSCSALCLT